MLISQQNECDKHLKNHSRWGLVRQTNLSQPGLKCGVFFCVGIPGTQNRCGWAAFWKEPSDTPLSGSLKISVRNVLM